MCNAACNIPAMMEHGRVVGWLCMYAPWHGSMQVSLAVVVYIDYKVVVACAVPITK
jgi:hypothetical protein